MRPLSQFCCGCSLGFGAQVIIICHLLWCIFYIANVSANVILRIPAIGFNVNLVTQTFNAAWCLVGLPFIFAALWGVYARLEVHTRLYLYYLVASFILDLGFIFFYLFIQDSCSMLPSTLKQNGSAFACGVTRLIAVTFTVITCLIQLYCVYVIWSFCEDTRAGGAGFGFGDLMASKGQRHRQPPLASYGAMNPGVGASQRIFDGGFHETEYPPRSNW
mmetsp:Transcript_11263/g.26938  ORF Transcript_11263/g.26938 Transcript_11263/m.26938 type:complete len:218 (+) Transcript_11263:113-766(+)